VIEIVKRSGEREPFDELKVRRSLSRSGASKAVEDKIIVKLERKLYQGITTAEIYRLVLGWLKQEEVLLASKYNLKQAIVELGPTGYPFELFLARLLKSFGFQTKTSQILSGKCVRHEVDVIAKTDSFNYLEQINKPAYYLVECKFHSKLGVKVTLKTALYVWGRLYDLQKVPISVFGREEYFTQGLLATNSRLTSEVVKYCQCTHLAALSWDYPRGNSLPDLISKSHKHPLTCLTDLSARDKQLLLGEGLVFCQDLLDDLGWQKLLGKKNKQILIQAKEMVGQE
jgi:hypothetical protein